MKTSMILMLLALFMPVLAGCSSISAVNSDYSISLYDIQVALQKDGSAVVTETISFDVLRNLTNFNLAIEYADAGSIQIDQVNILNRQDTGSTEAAYDDKSLTSNAVLGSNAEYLTQDDGQNLKIQIAILTEAGTTRTIQLIYRLSDAVLLNSDNAALVRRFFASTEQSDIYQLKLAIKLPEPIPEIETWTMPVSLSAFSISRPQEDVIQFQSDRANDADHLMLYCLFQPERFAAAKPAAVNRTWEQLTAAARKSAADLLLQDNIRITISNLAKVLLGLSIVLCLFIYWFFDREGRAQFRHHYWQTLPEGSEPAIMSILMNKIMPGRLIMATLLDLVRRNILTLSGNIFTLTDLQSQQSTALTAYEKHLLHFLFEQIATAQSISTADIRQFARSKQTAVVFQTNYTEFRSLLDIEIQSRNMIDNERAQRGRSLAWLASGCYLAIALVTTFYLRIPGGLLLLIPSAGMALYGWKIRRLTPVGRELYAMGQALKRTICDCDGQKIWTEPAFFANMLPLAVGFGIGDQLIKHLVIAGEDSKSPHSDYSFANYGILPSAAAWSTQIETLSTDLKVMESMLSSSVLLSAGLHW